MAPRKIAPSRQRGTFTLGNRSFPAVTWWKEPGLRMLYALLIIPLVTSMTNGYDGSMMNALQTSSQWQEYFNHPKGSLLAFYNLSFGLGQLVAVVPFPFPATIADKLGRRWGIVIGSIISIIGVAIQSASVNFGMFVGARFITGFGVMIDHGSAPLLVTELAHTQHRARITAVYNSTWYFGSIVAAWVTFGTINISNNFAWRIPSILQAFPALIQIVFVWIVPESPRFLIANDRHDQALSTLKKYHGNGEATDFVTAEFIEIQETLALEKEFASRMSWIDLLKTPGNRKRSLICYLQGFFSQWCGNGLVSYYLVPVLETVGITSSPEQAGLNGGLQIWNFIVAMWAAFNIDRFGRRPMVLTSTGSMVVCFVIWTILSAKYKETGDAGDAKGVIVAIFLQGLVLAYPIEILPYEIRAKGLSLTFFGVSSALLNQYINPVGVQNAGWKFYIFYDVFLVVIFVVVYFLWVETKNTPLEEIAKYFDGDEAKIGGEASTATSAAVLDQLRAKGDFEMTVSHIENTAEPDETA
ncbi:general substrate transporter [Rhizodiscina lignyota]|uniref:General substrate transporter n=1 Tax=Rhizodiscina lignyota TaxID=1504668 RepID=A0A9P4IB36_9PEZI|nr:general substrate transporter [Rhizodiscina lignyota]